MNKFQLVRKRSDNAKENKTVDLLMCISDHLSSRKDCKDMVYRVAIYTKDEEQDICRGWPEKYGFDDSIFFETHIRVFPDRYHRRRIDKSPVIQHVIINHFPEVWAGAANGCQCQIRRNMFVPGIYEYRISLNNKNRQWFKID